MIVLRYSASLFKLLLRGLHQCRISDKQSRLVHLGGVGPRLLHGFRWFNGNSC